VPPAGICAGAGLDACAVVEVVPDSGARELASEPLMADALVSPATVLLGRLLDWVLLDWVLLDWLVLGVGLGPVNDGQRALLT
jgi:hypothetical protein